MISSHVDEILFTQQDIENRVKELGAQITEDYKDKEKDGIIVLSVLKGAVFFHTDLIRHIDLKLELDFMQVSSYYGTKSNGRPRIVQDVTCDLSGKHVIVAEDVIDSGYTLSYLNKHFKARDAASVEICALFHKYKTAVDVDVNYVGFKCPDAFIVGYGLDYNQDYRNLPYVGILKQEYIHED